jgi:hypothetical protein
MSYTQVFSYYTDTLFSRSLIAAAIPAFSLSFAPTVPGTENLPIVEVVDFGWLVRSTCHWE